MRPWTWSGPRAGSPPPVLGNGVDPALGPDHVHGRIHGRINPVFGCVLDRVCAVIASNSPPSASRPWSLCQSRRKALRAGSKVMRRPSIGGVASAVIRCPQPPSCHLPPPHHFLVSAPHPLSSGSPILTDAAITDACGRR